MADRLLMNKNRVALYLGGVLLLTVVMAMSFNKYSQARTRNLSNSEGASSSTESQKSSAQQKIKDEISVSCDSNEELIESLAPSFQVIRIKFTDCNHFAKKSALYSIKNLTNGYDGQVFKSLSSSVKGRGPASTSMQLSTDYIQLENGTNIIDLEISLNDGQKINKKIRINR